MELTKVKKQILLATLTTIILGAQAFAGGSSTVGPGNPAAFNCLKLGGTLEAVETPAGQDANCVIEQWKLYHEMSQRGLDRGGLPQPAAVNCHNIQGTIRRVVDSSGNENGMCVVAQWTLFHVINVNSEQ